MAAAGQVFQPQLGRHASKACSQVSGEDEAARRPNSTLVTSITRRLVGGPLRLGTSTGCQVLITSVTKRDILKMPCLAGNEGARPVG